MNGMDWSWIERLGAGGFGLPESVALAAVAAIGYLFGRRSWSAPAATLNAVGPRQLHRAARIARQLEDMIDTLRASIVEHRRHVVEFRTKIGTASALPDHQILAMLSDEAENVILPTLRLANQLSHAYDELRQQSQLLANFTEGRTDPLTGLGNMQALREQLELVLSDRTHGGAVASIALVSVELPAEAAIAGDTQRHLIRRLAAEVERCIRETDYVARLQGAEFAVLLPRTPLAGARVFGSRLRECLLERLELAASCGLAETRPDDTPQAVLSRADSALYSARAAGQGTQFLHTGRGIQADGPRELVAVGQG